MWISVCCLLILFSILIGGAVWRDLGEDRKTVETQAEMAKPLTIEAAEQVIKPDLTEIYSEAGIVVRLKDGKVMTQFNQNERIFPASLTKIMTCIIALEQIEDLDEKVNSKAYSVNAGSHDGAGRLWQQRRKHFRQRGIRKF